MQSALTFTGLCYLDVTHSEHAVLYRESKKSGAKIGRSNLPQKEWTAKNRSHSQAGSTVV
ncbi:MAG: hypothetical protein IKI37_11830 [Oscillospiraceae bacterium]|nr:hypothetical protein [Oscillospiraceae bacterium]